MVRNIAVGLLAAAGLISGCATKPAESPVYTSLVLWPKGDVATCDFADPQREVAYAVSSTSTPRPASRVVGSTASHRYVVRDAQVRVRPEIGETLCLTLRRGSLFGPADAAIGFEVRAATGEDFDVTPVSAQINSAAASGVDALDVSIGLAAGRYERNSSDVASSAIFHLGTITADGRLVEVSAPTRRLHWPAQTGRVDILRLGAVVVEASRGTAIRDEDLVPTL